MCRLSSFRTGANRVLGEWTAGLPLGPHGQQDVRTAVSEDTSCLGKLKGSGMQGNKVVYISQPGSSEFSNIKTTLPGNAESHPS